MKQIENQCSGKICYESKEDANKSVRDLNEKGCKRVKTYKCGVCGKYHYGHESKNKLETRDKHVTGYVHHPKTHTVNIDMLRFKIEDNE